MRDDGILAMKVKLLCTFPNWGLKYSILMWRQDKDGKCMLMDGDPKPCKPNSMRNGSEIIKGISRFVEYSKELSWEDITRRIWNTHEFLIVYWDRIHLALLTLGIDTRMILV